MVDGIVEEEQRGKERAEYGKEIVKNLSKELTEEFGKGFGRRTLWEMRKLYVYFSDYEKVRTLFALDMVSSSKSFKSF